MSEELFDELEQEIEVVDGESQEAKESEPQEEVAVDEVKERRKRLLAGKEELTGEDFGDDLEAYEKYQKELERLYALAKGDEIVTKAVRQSLHKGEFRKFIPGGRVAKPKPKEPTIPELGRFKEKMEEAHEKFKLWLKESGIQEEMADFLNSIDYDGDVPIFTSYWNGANQVKKFIKENYG